jgi:hypothetical protein
MPAPQFAPPPGANFTAPPPAEPSRKIAEFKVSPFAVDWNLMISAYGPLRSGKLEIFTDKIQFTPGKLNVADPARTIMMSDVVSVEPCAVMMIPTGVKIATRGGESFTYAAGITGKREQLVEVIRRQLAALGA